MEIYRDKTKTCEERAHDLVSKMTLLERCEQLKFGAPAIERLSVEAYNWWNEGLHGVARAGVGTMFPQALDLGLLYERLESGKICLLHVLGVGHGVKLMPKRLGTGMHRKVLGAGCCP